MKEKYIFNFRSTGSIYSIVFYLSNDTMMLSVGLKLRKQLWVTI